MRTLTQSQAEQISSIDRTRNDGGLGVVYDGTNYLCRDVRNVPGYEQYAEILAASGSIETLQISEAQHIIDNPKSPLELATWAAIEEIKEELRAAKAGSPKPGRTDQELREAAKQRLVDLLNSEAEEP